VAPADAPADAPGGAPVPDAREAPPVTLIALEPRELLLHGLLTGSGWVVIAAIAGALWQVDLEGWAIRRYLPSTEGVWRTLRQATPTEAFEVALLVAGALLLFRLLSAAWSAIKHYQFALAARGDELFQSYGLLTRVGRTIPRARIQKITVAEEPLMRLFARAAITIDTAASVQEKHQQGAADGSHVLVPIVAASRVAPLVRDVYPARDGADLASVAWRGVDPRAFRRLLRVRLVLAAVAGAASYGAAHAWAVPIALGVALLLGAQAWAATRFTAFAWSGDTLWFRSGAWTRHVSVVRSARMQVVGLQQSPFDRRWGMAAVRVDTAGAASGGHRVHIRWLDAQVAHALYAELRRASAP
jgi:putative membrane protein